MIISSLFLVVAIAGLIFQDHLLKNELVIRVILFLAAILGAMLILGAILVLGEIPIVEDDLVLEEEQLPTSQEESSPGGPDELIL